MARSRDKALRLNKQNGKQRIEVENKIIIKNINVGFESGFLGNSFRSIFFNDATAKFECEEVTIIILIFIITIEIKNRSQKQNKY